MFHFFHPHPASSQNIVKKTNTIGLKNSGGSNIFSQSTTSRLMSVVTKSWLKFHMSWYIFFSLLEGPGCNVEHCKLSLSKSKVFVYVCVGVLVQLQYASVSI